ncbi:unnamed protein product [Calicophoron daubneyi]|uniref:Transforming acidic coiled-coil-containing protein C-terminal domain-containing protein n=1 Tax=Calicophoron daubneyi TaxID=300641 RepID=A0AAV2T1L5_CALDB
MGSNESSEENGMNTTKPTESSATALASVETTVANPPTSVKGEERTGEERTGEERTATPQRTQGEQNAETKLPCLPPNKENNPVGCNTVADISTPQTPQKFANIKPEQPSAKSTGSSLNQTKDVKLAAETVVPPVNPSVSGNVTLPGSKEVNRIPFGNGKPTSSPAASAVGSNQIGEQSKTQPTETNRLGPSGQKNTDSTPVNSTSVVPSSLPKQEAGPRTVVKTEVKRPDSSNVKDSLSQKQGAGSPVKSKDQKTKTGSLPGESKQPWRRGQINSYNRLHSKKVDSQDGTVTWSSTFRKWPLKLIKWEGLTWMAEDFVIAVPIRRTVKKERKPCIYRQVSSVTPSQSPAKLPTIGTKPSVLSPGSAAKSPEATSQVAKTYSAAGKLDGTRAEPPQDLENGSENNGKYVPAEGPHSSAESDKPKAQSPAERPLSAGPNWNEINWEEINESMNPFVHGNKIPLKSAGNCPPPMLGKSNSQAKIQMNPQPNLGDVINKPEDIQPDKNTSSATNTIPEQNLLRKSNSPSGSGTVTRETKILNSCDQAGLKQNLPSGRETSEQKKGMSDFNPLNNTSDREDRPVSAGIDWTKINWDEVGEDFNPFEKFNGHPPRLPKTGEGSDENSEQGTGIREEEKSPTPTSNPVNNSETGTASKPSKKMHPPDPIAVPVRTHDKPDHRKNTHPEDSRTPINHPQATQPNGEPDKNSLKTSDEKRGNVDERPLSKGIDWSEINWDEIDENFNPFGKADGIVNQPKSAVKTQPTSRTSGPVALSSPKDNKQIPSDGKLLPSNTSLDKKNKAIAKSSAVDKKSPSKLDGKAPSTDDGKEDVPVKAVIPTRNSDSKHETVQRQRSRSDIPVGGTGAYAINWDEIDETSDPFGGKLPSAAKKKVSETSGMNVAKSTDRADKDNNELTGGSNKQMDGHSDQLNTTEPKSNKQTEATKSSASPVSVPSQSATKSQINERQTTEAGSEEAKTCTAEKSGEKVKTMEERPLNSGGYNINWDEIDEMSNPFGKNAPLKPKTQLRSPPKVNSSGDGPGPKALDGELNSRGGNQASANLTDENEELGNSKPESECNHEETPTDLPGLAPSSGPPAPEELAQRIEQNLTPAGSSYWGGVWEQMMEIIRRLLQTVIKQLVVTDETPVTYLASAERTAIFLAAASDHKEGPESDEQDEMTGSVLNPLPPSNRDTSDQVPTLGRVDSSTRPASPAHPTTLARPSMDVGNVANGHSSPEAEIAALKKERDELRTTVDEMRRCIAEYDRSLQHLVEEKSQNQVQVNVSVADLITERDQAVEEVATIEKAFGDLHRRFEKSKQIIEGYKQNEETLKKSIEEYKQLLQRQETKYLALKKLAEEKLLKATQDTENAKQEFESQAARLQAALRLAELQTKSLESQLEQKTRENEELTKICDELLSKYGSST